MRTPAFAKPRLERLHAILASHVDSGFVPGLVALVARGDVVHVEALGQQSLESPAPMRRDTIFRIASITKPLVAAAAMILVEDCRIRLDDPITPFVPELANRRVLRSIDSELDDTVPARRPIILRDLLTSCMGFGSVMAMPDTYPIQRAIRELRIGGDGTKLQDEWPRTEEWIRNLGTLPLIAQPGERWMYHVSIDVLGVLIARIAGTSLGAFMRERLFEPLGMKDSSFQLPRDKLDRLAGIYRFDRTVNRLVPWETVAESTWLVEPPFESGGGGLLATIDDYHAFYRMLLDKGRCGRERILSRASVELMTSDQVTPEQRVGAELFFGGFQSWGFGLAVQHKRHDLYHNPGRFGWDGGFGTSAYADPGEDLIGLLFTQRLVDSPEPNKLVTDFWTLAYAALE
jgi:CubicO group peptidase (beta-lactamase class C family)